MKSPFHWILLSLLISCTQGEKNEAELVRAVANGIIDADNRADLEDVLSYYHPDAMLLPPGKQEITGIAGIRKNYENIFASSALFLSLQAEEVTVRGDVAICRGRTQGKVMVRADSSQRNVNDKFVMILTKTGQGWKIKRLIWN